ncbi:SdrD B-like domain-containing protein [Bizionia hallyeonensis]|uniref:SdrD B-like domain-containing protein n=1 Tax=Bizionia hallyeonensis TaxID=1123757 RepID=A0ABW0C4H2_9FLAO
MKKITFTIFTICLCITEFALAQTVIHVPTDQSTVQAAVNAASNNDIIVVANGTYNESINLATGPNGISIQAENAGNAIINGNSAPAFFAAGHTGNITISGFTLTSSLNSNSQGIIHMSNVLGHISVIGNAFSADNTNGIYLNSNSTIELSASILNNSFGNFGNDDLIKIGVGENGIGGDANILIDNNSNTGTLEDDAIEVAFENNNSHATLVITNNNFSNWLGSGSGIDVHLGNGSPAATNLEARFTIAGNMLTNVDGDALLINLDGINNTLYGTISNNTIIGDNLNTSNGMFIDGDSTSNGVQATLTINNNTISGIINNGIYDRPFCDDVSTDVWNLVINNNTIDNPNSDNSPADMSQAGILITDSSGIDDENYIINAEITNNTITNLNGVTDCIIIARPTTTLEATAIINYAASGNSCAPTLLGNPTSTADPVSNSLDLFEIGNLVWNDLDGNGIKDSGETGVEGVTIRIAGNGFLGSTTSNANGIYILPALTPGTYTLTAVPTLNLPDISIQNAGGDPTVDSDFDPITKTVNVTLTAGGSNNLDIDLGIYDSSTLGLTKVNFNAVSFYPNPVSNFLTINTQLTNYKYTIYSVQGQLITSKASNNQMQRIDFNNFATGVYVLIINTNEKSYSYKVIKK